EIGELTVKLAGSEMPVLEDLDPESCYLAWDLTVDTEAPREAITSVFDWAEGDCELTITEETIAAPVVAAPVAAAPVVEAKPSNVVNISDAKAEKAEASKPAAAEHAPEAPKSGGNL